METGWVRRDAWPRVAALLAVCLLALPLVPAEQRQAGMDEARTGFSPEPGPLLDDVAWIVQLDASKVPRSPPLIHGRDAYVLTTPYCYPSQVTQAPYVAWSCDPRTDVSGIFRIPLDRPEPELFLAFDRAASSFSMDADRVYVALDGELRAYDLATARRSWSTPLPVLMPDHDSFTCVEPAVRAGLLIVACTDWARLDPGAAFYPRARCDFGWVSAAFVMAVQTTDGAVRWTWIKNASAEARLDPDALPGPLSPSGEHCSQSMGVSIVGPVAVASTRSYGRYSLLPGWESWALDHQTGALRWWVNSTPDHTLGTLVDQSYPVVANAATGRADEAYVKLGTLRALNPYNGIQRWATPIGREDLGPGNCGSGMAMAAADLLVLGKYSVEIINLTTQESRRVFSLDPDAGLCWASGYPVVSGDVLYARASNDAVSGTSPNVTINTLHAIDWRSGRELWRHEFTDTLENAFARHVETALAPGVLVVAGFDGRVTALGATAASLAPVATVSNEYPRAGDNITLDLSATGPGHFGNATAFRAHWGDGPATDWQTSALFVHAYEANGTYRARFQARNDMNQTASVAETIFVGFVDPRLLETREAAPPAASSDPPEPLSFLQRAVAPETLPAFLLVFVAPWLLLLVLGLLFFGRRAKKAPVDVPRYVVERELGRGSFSRTYLARDTVLDRRVVLKQPVAPWLLEKESRDRFLKEARVLARLHHPNVVTLHEILEKESPPTLVLEYVEGGSLAARLQRSGPLAPHDAVSLLRDLLRGLQHVHREGIVHRDLKPANVLLDVEGNAKLTDFDIARPPKNLEAATIATHGHQPGSPLYMSPEQARGQELDARSDLYSLAVVLCEALTGRHYLDAEGQPEFRIREMIQTVAPDLDRRGIPKSLRRPLAKALAKDVAARFSDAEAFLTALDESSFLPPARTAAPSPSAVEASSDAGAARG